MRLVPGIGARERSHGCAQRNPAASAVRARPVGGSRDASAGEAGARGKCARVSDSEGRGASVGVRCPCTQDAGGGRVEAACTPTRAIGAERSRGLTSTRGAGEGEVGDVGLGGQSLGACKTQAGGGGSACVREG
ncbi:hypothetical protein B0H10DRAFT_2093997 [Mycena sp. CBHHK59/15]|nr:hypothetical protein B0H10DRAFT_2093997 [Mycena sp. CBHHK59/15]